MAMKSGRPNFLFFIADQLRFDHLGCYGNRIVKTPNIDALAAKAWVERRFLCREPDLHAEPRDLADGAHAIAAWRAPQRHSTVARCHHLHRSNAPRRLSHRHGRQGRIFQNMTGNPPQWPLDPKDRLPVEARADRRRALRSGMGAGVEGRPEFRSQLSFLWLRHRRSHGRAWRRSARPLPPLGQHQDQRRRKPDRREERAAGAGI